MRNGNTLHFQNVWKEAVVHYFNILTQQLPGTEENH
jgi:hypothetical protein